MQCQVASDAQLLIVDRDNKHNRFIAPDIFLSAKGGYIYAMHQGTAHRAHAFKIQSRDGFFYLLGKKYFGSLYVMQEKDRVYIINSLPLEEYLFSVVRAEGCLQWPLEAHKIMAVACRSYALAHITEANKKGRLYHIKNTNVHQVYNGHHEHDHIRDAIAETAGLFLSYNDLPIMAMYDICCGGVVPGHRAGKDGDFPYLKRRYACTYCKPYKVHSWRSEYTLVELERLLKKEVTGLCALKDIQLRKDSAGVVRTVALQSQSGTYRLPVGRFVSLVKKVKSYSFSVQKKSQRLIFNGRGYGHHWGLCQWGARGMVDHGYDFRSVLSYYYPGAQLTRLKG